MTTLPQWKVYAIRYATAQRTVHGNFLKPKGLKDGPMSLDFFVWVAINGDQVVMIDSGFNQQASARRNRELLIDPPEALRLLGVDADVVSDLVITHLHYDHAGNLDRFANARLHLQEAEMRYATGQCMCDEAQSHFFEACDIQSAVGQLFAGRICFHNGDGSIAAGISVHHIGGHTAGLQAVRIHTRRGWVLLASDAAHYYANKALKNPFPAIYDMDEMLRGYQRLDELADSPAHMIPGHDPQVLKLYPALKNPLDIAIAKLHCEPLAEPEVNF